MMIAERDQMERRMTESVRHISNLKVELSQVLLSSLSPEERDELDKMILKQQAADMLLDDVGDRIGEVVSKAVAASCS